MEKFIITKDIVKRVKRFSLNGRSLEFKIKPVPESKDPIEWIKSGINEVVKRGTEDLQPGDQVGLSFCSKSFEKGDGWIRFQPIEKVTFDHVWDVIASVYQSNSCGLGTETFCLGITSVRMPTGRGRGRNYNSFQEECIMRRGIVSINNKDNMCLPRALVVSKAYVDKDPAYKNVRKDTRKTQTQRALQLMNGAGITIPEDGAGIPEIEKFQLYLKHYRIVVYTYGNRGRDVIFKGVNEGPTLNLIYHEGHYNVLTSLTAAFCCVYYCEECHIPYNTKETHRCGGTCMSCNQSPICRRDQIRVKCGECKRNFMGRECYENHKRQGSYNKSTVCAQIRRCEECFKTIKSSRQHFCGEVFCKICHTHVISNHQCYMPLDKGTPKTDGLLLVFYDLETRQEDILQDGSLLHKPSLCVFQQRCDLCINEETLYFCQKCGVRKQVLKEDVIANLLTHILTMRKQFKQVIVIGHNGGGFDHQLVLNFILHKTDLSPELVTRGTKLIVMQIGNVKFLDSLNYFSMALSKLPKVFGLTELKKGYFPHIFNTLENQKYVGPIPALEFYDPDNMKSDEREKFICWYNEQLSKNYVFDFQKEIVEYCVSDVEILAQACLKFRKLMLEEGNVCPFTESTTLPSACNKIFRRNFLKPETIGIIPKNGYRWQDNQSKIAIEWLLWEEHQRGINIVHAAKKREAVVAGVKVDGFCPENNLVLEFHGCMYHGCKKCIKYNRDQPTYEDPSDTMEHRFEATVAKIERLRQRGYEVVEKWECDFRRELAKNKEMQEYTQNHPLSLYLPLNPRDAFYGGRTGATKMYYKTQGDEKIKYVDVCSLYPWVNKYGKYPVGHPQIYVGEECNDLNISETEGLIKCKVLPPRNLYHPVLPVKMNDKLMFVLCRTCGEGFIKEECVHSESERCLIGTWVIDELKKSLQKGYRITEVYEIWKYKVEQYNPETQLGGLFSEYISKFLRIKQQASGYPSDCNTTDKKEEYLKQYLEREGVTLDPGKINVNPGLRQLGKAVITSFWGKLGQRENQAKTSIVKDPGHFFNILSNPALYVNTVLPVNETCLIVNWQYREESYDILPTVNVCLAAYTTAQARLKLYSYLENLEKRVLYYDTDSVIYISRPGEYEVPLGSFLGEMTDELEGYGSGSYITEFASGGPKLYAYRVYTPETNEHREMCKVKGITINSGVSNLVNFEKLRDMILNEEAPVYICSKNILRTAEHNVVTKETKKIFRTNFAKRKLVENYDSVPYGYKRMKTDVINH